MESNKAYYEAQANAFKLRGYFDDLLGSKSTADFTANMSIDVGPESEAIPNIYSPNATTDIAARTRLYPRSEITRRLTHDSIYKIIDTYPAIDDELELIEPVTVSAEYEFKGSSVFVKESFDGSEPTPRRELTNSGPELQLLLTRFEYLEAYKKPSRMSRVAGALGSIAMTIAPNISAMALRKPFI